MSYALERAVRDLQPQLSECGITVKLDERIIIVPGKESVAKFEPYTEYRKYASYLKQAIKAVKAKKAQAIQANQTNLF